MPEQYFIIGADGKEYGPIPLDTLILWIHERRLIGASRVRAGNGSYTEAASLPELAAFFAPATFAQPVVPSASGISSSPGFQSGTQADFKVWNLIGQAWDLVKSHWLVLGGMLLILGIIGGLARHVPHIGCILSLAIDAAVMIGIWRAILGMIDGRAPTAAMMFEGFDRFGDAFLAGIVRLFLIVLGLICLIVPGIILAVMWIFTYPIISETRIGFWEAMGRSSALTEGYRWKLFLLALAGIPVCALGLIFFFVGVFISGAVMMTAFGLAYRFIKAQKQAAGQAPAQPAGQAATQPA
ncbi:MAG TPA: hypothetical protein VGA64_01400 [Candidatus Polarisedimenticolia bacterium]